MTSGQRIDVTDDVVNGLRVDQRCCGCPHQRTQNIIGRGAARTRPVVLELPYQVPIALTRESGCVERSVALAAGTMASCAIGVQLGSALGVPVDGRRRRTLWHAIDERQDRFDALVVQRRSHGLHLPPDEVRGAAVRRPKAASVALQLPLDVPVR